MLLPWYYIVSICPRFGTNIVGIHTDHIGRVEGTIIQILAGVVLHSHSTFQPVWERGDEYNIVLVGLYRSPPKGYQQLLPHSISKTLPRINPDR